MKSQQPDLQARGAEIKGFKHSWTQSCITDALMFYFLIYLTFASHRKIVCDGFSFPVPTTELAKLAEHGEPHRNQEVKASWLDFPLLSHLYRGGSSYLLCNQRGQLCTAWACEIGESH